MKIPTEYKTGIAYFMDFEFKVSPDTLIPRPETELLVEKAIETAEEILRSQVTGHRLQVLDIGTGCGNIAISLTKYLVQSKITAVDISYYAVKEAIKNAKDLGVSDKIDFIVSDALSPFKEKELFDVVVSNPPYVSEAEIEELSEEVKLEPRIALYGGFKGMDFHEEIIKQASLYLKKAGFILLEIGYDQAASVKNLLEKHKYKNIEIFKDYNGIDRVLKAQLALGCELWAMGSKLKAQSTKHKHG